MRYEQCQPPRTRPKAFTCFDFATVERASLRCNFDRKIKNASRKVLLVTQAIPLTHAARFNWWNVTVVHRDAFDPKQPGNIISRDREL